jgi:hypothetical protein
MSTQTYIGTLAIVQCCHEGCGVPFGMPENWKEHYLNNHQRFFCPAGHGQSFPSKSREEQLAADLAEAQRKLTQEKCTIVNLRESLGRTQSERDRQARLKRENARKLKRICVRVSHGVCPCCNRTVKQMAAHMASKHPEYVANKGES